MTDNSRTQVTPTSVVFISYASPDAAVANAIVEVLEKHGIPCWIAPRDVKAGAQYADAIVRAITGAKALVLVLSANAIESTHVGKEIERATAKKRQIITLRVDAAPLTPALEYFLSESQWIEAPPGKEDAAYAKLIAAIREPVCTPVNTATLAMSSDRAAASQPTPRRKRILLAAGLAAAAIVAAVLSSSKLWLPKHLPAEQPTTSMTSAAVINDKSIAVLPFVDMSEKHDQEYMSDGMAEELLNLLAQAPGLKVIARTSSFAFKGKAVDVEDIAKKLNVAYVLEGSVRKSGHTIRITAQLIRTTDSTQIWSAAYDRPLNDLFKLQDEIAGGIVQVLQIRLAGGELNRRKGGTQNLEAYQLYLRAADALNQDTRPSVDAAAGYLEKATKLDPSFGLAWSRLANVYLFKTVNNWLAPADGLERTRQLARHALEVSPDLAEAHALLMFVYRTLDWNWAAADSEGQRALAMDPTNPFILDVAGNLSFTLGKWNDAERQLRSALTRDPLNIVILFDLATTYYLSGRFVEAEAMFRRTLEQAPHSAWTPSWLAKTLLAQGKSEAALAMAQQEADERERLGYLAIFLQAVDRQVEADEALKAQIKQWADTCAVCVARTYAYRGEEDSALEWLERAYKQKDAALISIVGEPLLKNLWSDPRYKAFLRKMNLPE